MGRYKTKLPQRKAKRKNVPVWLILSGIGLILVALVVFLSSIGPKKADIEVTGAPKLKVEQDIYNYGDVKLGGVPIRTVVTVTNVGDQPLRFKEAPYVEVLEGC